MATNLAAGSIAFTGYNGDGNDNLSFVVLTDVAQGTVINFTDNDWNDGQFASGDDAESIFTWTATSDVAAGTVIEIDNLKDAELDLRASTGSAAWVNTHNTGLKDTNETVYAYVGSSSSPAFLAAIANNGFSDNGTLTGTGLIEGVTAIDLGNKVATSGYTGPLSGQASFADYLSYINNTSYWSTEAGAPFSKAPFSVGDDGNDTPVGGPGDTDDAADDVINIPSGTVLANKISVKHSMAITVGGTLTVVGDRAITADDGLDDGSILTVDVLQGGSITAGDDAIRIKGNVKDGTVNIDNAGTITANGGQAIDLTDVTSKSTTITITNEAGGVITAIDADAVRGGGNTVINNSGVITSVATGDDVNDGIDFQDDGDGTVYNHTGGSIIGAHHGITGAQGITVVNEVGGTIIGQSGSAVNIDNEGGVENTVTVTNHGTMLGNANPAQDDSDGDAIDVDGLLTLDNYGLIDGTGANGTHDGGANVSEGVAAGGGTINNYEGGTIHGYGRAIQIDDSENGGALAATTIYNEGTIQGDGHGPENSEPGSDVGIILENREAIDILGTFADTITNKGTILGGVFTDGGDDTLTNSGTMTALKTIAIDMGDGDDKVILQAGSNITGAILLGAGDDSLTATGVTKEINVDGGDGNDTIVGTDAGDTIAGGAGNDTITGGKGADKLSGGDGDDTFKLGLDMLGSGTRTIVLGDGTTQTVSIEGLAGTQDVISGGADYDKIVLDKAGTSGYVFDTAPASSSYTGIEEIDGTSGNDVIMVTPTYQSDAVGGGIKLDGGAGNDTLGGGAGNDTILGGDGNDLISGLGGNDNLQGAAGNDVIWGGDGDDSINGGSGADVLHGDAGADTIYGSDGDDEIHGGDGNDQLQGEGGNDTIYGDAGSDFVVGGDGNDTIYGGDGNDQLFGQNGDDTIDGGAGADKLSGDAGNDTLIAGAGDTVLGGTGDDAIIVSIQDGNPASIDGGDGNDTVHLTGQGTGAFGKTTSVETLDVDAGTWTVKGTGNYDAINIAAGATMVSQISVEHSMAITVGGTLTVDGDRAITADDGLDDGSTLTVTVQEGGLITSGDDAIRIKGDFDGGTVSIDNAGTIVANGGQAIDLTDVTSESTAITITNEKTGVITAADADAIRGGGNTTIDNYGVISSVVGNDPDPNDAIDFQDDGKGTVHNRTGGSIIGAHHGITGSQGITVINDEDALISGVSGSAVNIDNKAGVDNMVTVTNYGTMLGNADERQDDSDGDAVDVDGLLHLDNYGEIRGTGAYGYHDGNTAAEANVSEGIATGGGIINNYAGATIYGYGRAIQIDNSANGPAAAATTIYNEGTIQGDGHGPANVDADDAATVQANMVGREAIDIIGTFDDTITNKGTIIGGVFTDGGNDTFNAYVGSTVSKTIDLGDGTDTVNLFGNGDSTAKGTLGTVVNAENLNVEGGTWTFADGATNFTNITVDDGATVTNGITVGDGDHLVVEAGATVSKGTATSAVTWTGGTTTIDNYGTITSTNQNDNGIRGTVTGGDLTFVNHEGADMDALVIVGGPAGSSLHITNAGTMSQINAISNLMDVTIDNTATGVITTDAANRDIVKLGGSVHFTNEGRIVSVPDTTKMGGEAIEYGSGGTGVFITNSGYIEGSHHAVTGESGATIVNEASGIMIGRNGSAVNVDNGSTEAETVFVTNYGDMEGRSAGYTDSDGDAVDVDGLVKIDNYGQIQGLGANGYHDGTAATDANISEGIAVGGGVINNYAGATIYGYGRAIEVDDSANGAAPGATTIYNEGTIQGGGHGPTGVLDEHAAEMQARINGAEAIDIIGTQNDTITNTATGKIIGGIFTDGGADTLTNAGTITAMAGSAVNMGDGDDTVTNTGTITGAVLLGAGDDTFNVNVGSKVTGTIDGGDGVDTVNLQGTGTGSFGSTVNVEKLNVQGGSWTISGSQNYRAIDVANGATIAAAVILGAGEVLTVEQGGTVQGSSGAVIVNGGTSDTSVTNDGSIKVLSAAGNKIDAITVNSGTVTVHNTEHGVIEGARHAITGPGAITVINDKGGLIVGHNGSAVNMDNGSSEAQAAHITNYGMMLGDSAEISDSDGDAVDVDGLVYLDNYGTIRGEGANGTHKGEANVSEGVAAGGGTIHNYAGATIYGYGRAIQIDNSSNASAFASTTIINDGTIQGDGNGPKNYETGSANNIHVDDREAIDILGNFADTITNTATGKIIGGVFTDGGDDKLTNSGSMTAVKDMAIDMGAGNDSVMNLGTGTITGSVALGDGDDSLSNDGAITVTHGNAVSMGDGNDYLGLNGTITGNVDAGAGNDEVNIQSSGHLFGTVSFGDGNDKLQSLGEIKADAGGVAVDMGAGDDMVQLQVGATVQGTIQLGDGNDVLSSVANGGFVIDGGAGDDQIYMSSTVIGGDDVVNGGAGNDIIYGGLGNDTLDGGEGNDTLKGETGNDTLIGGDGSDTFNYVSGDGSDTIVEGAGNAGDFDTLNLKDFDINDVKLVHSGDDLVITLKDGSMIVVSDQFADGGVENIVFKDGEIDRGGIVDATNHAPTVDPTTATVDEDKSIDGQIIAHDLDGDKLTYQMVPDNAEHHGTLVLSEDGQWTYTPDKDYNGHDSFIVRVSDGHTTVDTTIDVTVNPVNDAPVAVNDVGQVGEHDTKVFDLTSNDTDVDDGQPHLTHFSVDGVEGIDLSNDAVAKAFQIVDGKLQFVGGDIFGALNDGDHATVTITYTAEDSHGAPTTGEFTLTVDGVTDMHQINGTSGSDVIVDTSADDHITAGNGNDIIMTSQGSDIVDAGAGDDTVMARTGNATVNGGDGNDTIVGGSGNTVLNGDAGNDTITGGSGNETLNGGDGNDTLISTGGKDILIGGHGNDLLIGGANSDTFVFKPGDGQDTVANFTAGAGAGHDVIEVDTHSFANFDAVMAAIHDTASGAQLQYADGSTMTLNGVTKAHLTVDDFHFA